MLILAIDPGPERSAWVLYNSENGELLDKGIDENEAIVAGPLTRCPGSSLTLVIEMVASYGMPVGKSTFETCVWIGHFERAWGGLPRARLYRKTVCSVICGSGRAKDANVRQALIDRFGGIGGKQKAVGTKKEKGPLWGIKTHLWSAVAIAVAYADLHTAQKST